MKRSLVVYESKFGNTRAIADAVAQGMKLRGEVQVPEVSTAPLEIRVRKPALTCANLARPERFELPTF